MKRVANWSAREFVKRRKEFKGNNTWGTWNFNGTRFTVYSYGNHHPLFIYDDFTGTWFENGTRVSRTTSKHRSQLHPCCDTHVLSTADMCIVERDGVVALIEKEVLA